MSRILLIAVGALIAGGCCPRGYAYGSAGYVRHVYWYPGPHQVPDGSWCTINVRHEHPYAPFGEQGVVGGTVSGQIGNSDQGGQPPGHGGTPPGQGGDNAPPGHGGTPPGHGGTPPGHNNDGTPPGHINNPGHGGQQPASGGNNAPPAGGGKAPGQGGTPPAQNSDSTPPGQTNNPGRGGGHK